MLNNVDSQFHALYQNLITNGHLKGDRTGHGTMMLPAQMMRFDCTENKLPILSTRFIPTKAFRREMLWFVSGKSSIKYLRDHKVGVWDSWFIPGTDRYDEPVTIKLDVEGRLKTKEAVNNWQEIDFILKTLQEGASVIGSTHLEMTTPDGTVIEYNNLSSSTYVEFSKYLDTIGVPNEITPSHLTLSFKERIKHAEIENKGPEVYEFTRTLPSEEASCGVEIRVTSPAGQIVTIGLSKSQMDTVDEFLTTIGIPTERKNGGEKISIQRRLARVSKNDAQKWEEINLAMIPDPSVDWDGETYRVTVFKGGKFQDVTLDYGQYINVEKTLNALKVPAYELLDADIGAGGYGPNWRKWKDTQIVGTEGELQAYVAQGYEVVTEISEYNASYRWAGKHVVHREIDQLQNAINMLKVNADDRRMLVTAWNPGRTWQAALPPCHLYFQFVSWVKTIEELNKVIDKAGLWAEFIDYGHERGKLPDFKFTEQWALDTSLSFCNEHGLITRNLTLFVLLRSSDAPLGLCFNTAQYAYLLHMVGHVVNMDPNELVSVGVDTHLYNNQIPMIEQLLERKDSHPDCDPRVVFNRKVDNIDDFTFEDIDIVGYHSLEKLDIPVAV